MDPQTLIAELDTRYDGVWDELGYLREAIVNVIELGDQASAEVKVLAIEEIMRRHDAALDEEARDAQN